ncbi:MAG: hypothetical protein V1835_00670 [Candidatus Micrarchaeota archaeon]
MVIELDSGQLMFELTPPPRRASAAIIQKNLDKIQAALSDLPLVNYINVPEVIEENRLGEPLYRNMDVCVFGKLLKERTQREIIVNKVTPQLESNDDFQKWLDSAVFGYSISNFIFVGGSRGDVDYSGPSVLDANMIASKNPRINIGNIFIPSRQNEASRLVSKTQAGCSFFTTQVIFESGSAKHVLQNYDLECGRLNIKPSSLFLSFAPMADAYDLEFCKWLGALVPPEIEARLLASPEKMGEISIQIASDIFSEIISYCEDNGLDVPISLNVEPLSMHNLELAAGMVRRLQPLMQ